MTDSMKKAIGETNRRRGIQQAYNDEHGITPTSIKKAVRDIIRISKAAEKAGSYELEKDPESMDKFELEVFIEKLSKEMKKAAADLQFERAASLRDELLKLKTELHKSK